MNYNPTENLRIKQVLLERFQFHATRTCSLNMLAPMMAQEAEFAFMLDQYAMDFACRLYTTVVKGESTHETKSVEFEYEFNIFASWSDHLKFRIKERWRLPQWIKKRIHVRYQKVVKKHQEAVPVTVIRVCPHATFNWEKHERVHAVYLFPSMEL